MPFEIQRITIEPDGFKVAFTKPVDKLTGTAPESYAISTFTHPYHGGYGGPEIEQSKLSVQSVALSDDGLTAKLKLESLKRGHVHEFDFAKLRAQDGEEPLHRNAYYTVNEIPKS